jgi:hypothetical protein
MITQTWAKKSWTESMIVSCTINKNISLEYKITLLCHIIEKSSEFELNILLVEKKYYEMMKKDKCAIHLLSALKTLINELLKLNKKIPTELDFIKNDDNIKPIELIKSKTKRISRKKKTQEIDI